MRGARGGRDVRVRQDDQARLLAGLQRGLGADTDDELYIFKSVYDGAERATGPGNGFVRDGNHWERFDEFRNPTLFPAPAVVAALQEAGWTRVLTANSDDLRSPVTDPEKFDRILFVAASA
jgi:hypothetical protein